MGAFLSRLVVGHPRKVLLGALVAALAVLPLVLRLRLDTDLVSLIPQSSPGAAAFARFTRLFVGEQVLIALVEGEDPARLVEFADRYAEAMRARPGIVEVRARLGGAAARLVADHLLQLLDDGEIDALAARTTPEALRTQARRLRGLLSAPGGSALAPLITIDPLELLPQMQPRLQAGLPVDTTTGYFRSADGKALLLFIRPSFGPFEIERSRALLDDARATAARLGARPGDATFSNLDNTPTVDFTGAYAYSVEYKDWLHRDMELSTIVSAITVLLFFALLLGALRVLPIVAAPLLLGLWLTGAFAGGLYGRVNAVSLAFGTILLSIGIDLPIQFYNRLREELSDLAPGERPARAIGATVEKLAATSLLATLGPAAVFFACVLSDYKGLGELGVLAGVGLLINFLTMLIVFPALLVALPARLWLPRRRPSSEGAWFASFGRATARRPVVTLLVVAAVTAAALPLALRLRYDRRLISVEPQGMHAARTAREVERRLGGRQSLLVSLVDDRDPDRALARADAWRAEAERLRKAGVLASYQTISNLFPSKTEQSRRRARLDRLNPARIAADLRAALIEVGFDIEPFNNFLSQLERPPAPLTLADAGTELRFLVQNHVHDDPNGGRTVATFLFPPPGRADEAVKALEAFAAASPDHGAVTGVSILEDALRRVVERDTLRVTAVSVAAVLLLLIAYYRRLRQVLAVILPLSVAWILFAAALGAFDVRLNLFNLLAVPLIVGYGIDDHLFLVHRHTEHDPPRAPEHALASTGRAIVVTSLSTMAGFAGLAVARFDGLRLLGITGGLAVLLCLFAALAVLPALLALLWPSRPSDS